MKKGRIHGGPNQSTEYPYLNFAILRAVIASGSGDGEAFKRLRDENIL
jgi:hypothetical protein